MRLIPVLGGLVLAAIALKWAADRGLIDAAFDWIEFKQALRRHRRTHAIPKASLSARQGVWSYPAAGMLGINDSPRSRSANSARKS